MKIVYFNYLYDMKESSVGAAVHVKELERALEKCGHQIKTYDLNRFTSVEASVKSKFRNILKNKFYRYFNQLNSFLSNGRYFIKEWKIISSEKPDIVLMRYNLLNFSLSIVALIKRVPYVLEVNAQMAYESRCFARNIVQLPFIPEFVEKINLLLAKKIVVVSGELKKFYLNWNIPKKKITVVPNGADEQRFHPQISSKNILSRFKLDKKIVIGFIGSFHYWHGVENLSRFIKVTLSNFDNAVFLLVGIKYRIRIK